MSVLAIQLDGREVRRPVYAEAEVVVVGSGPAGAVVAARLAERGLGVLVLEEGFLHTPESFPSSGVRAMARLYREMGTSMVVGNCPMPYLQGVAVGGTSVINGAISWRLAPEVLEGWYAEDPALREALAYEQLAEAERALEGRLGLAPTPDAVAGRKNLLMAEGAERLGVAHRPIVRNVVDCQGSGRCIQGCPHGKKLSVDRTLLPDAVARGAKVFSGVRVERVLTEGGRAVGVRGRTTAGALVEVRATHAVVLAASAIQTPVLLQDSGLRRGPVGEGLCGHPGLSVTARFEEPVRNHRGATQGHEVTGWRGEGLKLEALGMDAGLVASRVPGYGRDFARRLAGLDRYAVWGAALRASARGSVRSVGGRPLVRYSLTREDVLLARRGVLRLAETLLAAGASEVYPGVGGGPSVLRDARELDALEDSLPVEAGAYSMSITHLFGTARMGSDPARTVVDERFEHREARRLFLADSSVFPGNLGVNPQLAIMAVASLCAARVASA